MNEEKHSCAYCGNEATYQLKNGKWCCCKFNVQCPANRAKNRKGVLKAYQNGLESRKHFSEDARRRQGWSRGLTKETSIDLKERGERLSKKYQDGLLVPSQLGRTHSEEEINRIVYGMTHFRKGNTNKGFKRGWYNGEWYDSSWELAFALFNNDHQIKFKRNTTGFTYTYQNKKHTFYPDFIMEDNTYIEIKGWKSDSTLAKIEQFPKDKILTIIDEEGIQIYLNYVIEHYGINFWNLLETENIQ